MQIGFICEAAPVRIVLYAAHTANIFTTGAQFKHHLEERRAIIIREWLYIEVDMPLCLVRVGLSEALVCSRRPTESSNIKFGRG
jgi:hypothetical protein